MSRYNFFLFAVVLMACVYISNANPVKRQAEMGSGSTDSDSSGSGSSGSDSTAPTPSPGSGSSGSDSSGSDSGSGSSGSDSGSESSGSDSLTTGGLLPFLAKLIEKIPIGGTIAKPFTSPILNSLAKFLG